MIITRNIQNEFIRLGLQGIKGTLSSLPDFVDILVTYAGHTVAVEIRTAAKCQAPEG